MADVAEQGGKGEQGGGGSGIGWVYMRASTWPPPWISIGSCHEP